MKFVLIAVLIFAATADAQSGRSAAVAQSAHGAKTAKQMFDEANEYNRVKFAEYQAKKVPYSEQLRQKTDKERKQLAAKYAAIATAKSSTEPDEIYYAGMLHWIAENMDMTAETLVRFVGGTADATRRQNALAILVFVHAKLGKLDDATKYYAEYEKGGTVKTSEIWRMNTEIAKGFITKRDHENAATYAYRGYTAAKELIRDPASRVNPLDAALDAGMLVFEAYRNANKITDADAILNDMRETAGSIKHALLYFYATDKLITHQIDTGRKELAMETYLSSLIEAGKTVGAPQGNEAIDRLKRREKHYKMLGEPATELFGIDKWFPGTQRPLSKMKGKVVLLDFWATWCGPCFDAFPHFREWHADLSDKGLVILGITRYYGRGEGFDVDEPNEILFLKRFREKHALPYDFVVTKDQQLHGAYGAVALPTAILIDRKGVVRYIETGSSPSRLEEMRAMVLKLIDEE
jgi:cytochrome c biogenesis protein CcmG/thiol:disulfide interchange protein DsbE